MQAIHQTDSAVDHPKKKGAISMTALGVTATIAIAIVGGLMTMINQTNDRLDSNISQDEQNTANVASLLTSVNDLKTNDKAIRAEVDQLLENEGYSPAKVVNDSLTTDQ